MYWYTYSIYCLYLEGETCFFTHLLYCVKLPLDLAWKTMKCFKSSGYTMDQWVYTSVLNSQSIGKTQQCMTSEAQWVSQYKLNEPEYWKEREGIRQANSGRSWTVRGLKQNSWSHISTWNSDIPVCTLIFFWLVFISHHKGQDWHRNYCPAILINQWLIHKQCVLSILCSQTCRSLS